MLEFSIIVVSYNTKPLTINCLASVLAKAKSEVEIILVDNHSTDETTSAVRGQFTGVKIITNSANLGFAKAVNQGLALARGRKIVLLNSDTELDQLGDLEKLAQYLDRHPEIGLLAPAVVNHDGSPQPLLGHWPSIQTQFFQTFQLHRIFPWGRTIYPNIFTRRLFSEIQAVDWLAGACLIARREFINRLGPMDEHFFFYFEDTDWCRRTYDLGYRVVRFPEVRVFHRHQASSQQVADKIRALIAERQSILYFYRKHAHPTKKRLAIFRWLFDLMIRLRAWRWLIVGKAAGNSWGQPEIHRQLLKELK